MAVLAKLGKELGYKRKQNNEKVKRTMAREAEKAKAQGEKAKVEVKEAKAKAEKVESFMVKLAKIEAKMTNIEANKETELKQLRQGFKKERLKSAHQSKCIRLIWSMQNQRTEQPMSTVPSCRTLMIVKTKWIVIYPGLGSMQQLIIGI